MAKRKLALSETDLHARQFKEASKKKVKKESSRLLVPSGSTMLNNGCSDDPYGAYVPGTMINMIGDTSAGKSFLALTMLAEICYDKRFDEYDLIYDDIEKTNEFDMEYLFGKKFIQRLILRTSTYAEEVGDHLYEICQKTQSKKGKPFILVTDSWDALKSKYEEDKEKKNITKRKKGQKEEGSYGDRKAAMLHKFCRLNLGIVEKSESLWVVVSQTKDNFSPDAIFNPKIVTGGNAIKFFPSHRIWLTIASRDREKGREIGVFSKIKVVKNKFSGKRRNVNVPIYYDYGVDDIGSCIDFLNSDYGGEYWKTRTRKNKETGKSFTAIDAKDLDIFLKRKKLIKYIEDNSLENDLKAITGKVWNDIEESIRLDRKPKFE